MVLDEIGRFFAKHLVPGYIDERETNIFEDVEQDSNDNNKEKNDKGFEAL